MSYPRNEEEYDDENRLPLRPPGTRKESHVDSSFANQLDHQMYNGPAKKLIDELYNAGPVDGPGDALIRLQKIGKLRSSVDALTATLLADSVEQVNQSFADMMAEQQANSPQEYLEAQRSAEFYGVDPGDDQTINSNFIAEAAVALRETPQKVSHRMFVAKGLRHVCTNTLTALAAGDITEKAAHDIVRFCQDLTPEQVSVMEEKLLEAAKTASDSTIYQKAKRFHDRMNPEAAASRHEKSAQSRKVTEWYDAHGMGTLKLYHRADVIKALSSTLRWVANQNNDPQDTRTTDQLLADVYSDALVHGWPGSEGTPLKPRLSITIPALDMLVNPDKTLADLEGYGPIPVSLALELAKDAPSFQRVLTDPWTGAVIDVERRNYRPTQGLKDLLRLRDVHCCFPGCRRSADRSEIDHIDDWAHGGKTERENTHLLCKQHQMFKHALGWKVVARADGTKEWVTPHGLKTIITPESMNLVVRPGGTEDRDRSSTESTAEPSVRMTPDINRVLGYPMDLEHPETEAS